MNRAEILEKLDQHRGEFLARFGAKHLSLFGSAARDELREESDVDVLVEFEQAATYDGYFGLKEYLESIFGRPVDLVTEKGLKPRACKHVEKDLTRVA